MTHFEMEAKINMIADAARATGIPLAPGSFGQVALHAVDKFEVRRDSTGTAYLASRDGRPVGEALASAIVSTPFHLLAREAPPATPTPTAATRDEQAGAGLLGAMMARFGHASASSSTAGGHIGL